jgi:hypothetical protein
MCAKIISLVRVKASGDLRYDWRRAKKELWDF